MSFLNFTFKCFKIFTMKPFLYSSQRIPVGKHILFLFFMSLVLPGFSPKTCLADAKRIIEENKGGVVILFSYDKEGNQTGHATGFIVSNDGVVLTNYHFISKAARIEIKTEEKILEARGLLYIDKGNDIAALKIEGKDFPALKIRDNGAGPEGQKIYLIGSPRGEEKILLEGMLSRIKDITPERKLLLLTVPVTEGSSGSPPLGSSATRGRSEAGSYSRTGASRDAFSLARALITST